MKKLNKMKKKAIRNKLELRVVPTFNFVSVVQVELKVKMFKFR